MRARSMKVIDLAVRHVECISATTSVTDCALAMRTRHVGSLVVVDGGNKPIGMITDRDLTIEVLATGRDIAATKVGDVMTSPAVVAQGEENIVDALARMREFGIRRLPVVDENGLLVVSSRIPTCWRNSPPCWTALCATSSPRRPARRRFAPESEQDSAAQKKREISSETSLFAFIQPCPGF